MKVRHEGRVRELLDSPMVQAADLGDSAATQLARQVDPSVADFAILTALPIELAAILKYFPTLEKVNVGPESRTYFQGVMVAHDGLTKYRVVVSLLKTMGNVEAAASTAEVIRDWNPRYIVMCGIGGGLRSDCQRLGDVIVSTEVIYYERGKVRDVGIERRPVSYQADSLLIDRAMHMHQGTTWRARLPDRPDGGQLDATFPAVQFGPIASGDKVIASTADAASLRELHPQLLAVEMEGGGVATSAYAVARRVGFFMVRSICDFADRHKDDSWQDFAAHAAASFLGELLANRPIAPAKGDWTPVRTRKPVRIREEVPFDPVWVRTVFFPKVCNTLNMEDFRDFCYIIQIDVDNLPGESKRAKVRELLQWAERRGRLKEVVEAYDQFLDENW